MNENEARSILSVHRTDEPEAADSRFTDAEKVAQNSPPLAEWWKNEKETDRVIASKFAQTHLPAGMKERLLRPRRLPQEISNPRRGRAALFAAAAIVAAAIIFSSWRGPFQPETSLAEYRDEMVSFIKVDPGLEFESEDLGGVQKFLAKAEAPAGFDLPEKLKDAGALGCRVLRFRGHNVSLVCFRAEDGKLVHLFVTDSSAMPGWKTGDDPTFAAEGEWMTAAWTEGGRAYLLTVKGDRESAEKLVGDS